nr:MAG TPA: hypothetical protein [Bacteriophage sp.]
MIKQMNGRLDLKEVSFKILNKEKHRLANRKR